MTEKHKAISTELYDVDGSIVALVYEGKKCTNCIFQPELTYDDDDFIEYVIAGLPDELPYDDDYDYLDEPLNKTVKRIKKTGKLMMKFTEDDATFHFDNIDDDMDEYLGIAFGEDIWNAIKEQPGE